MESIDFMKMLEKSKKRMAIESKAIKKMSLYNYLNDNMPSLIIDCRKEGDKYGLLRYGYELKNFPYNNVIVKNGSRLITILDDDQDLKTSNELEALRSYIQQEDRIDKGLFTIKNSDYQDFLKDFSCFVVNEESDEISKQLAKTSFPLMILDKFIYVGNFFNSKNLYQMKILKIASIVSLLKEEDAELNKMIANVHFIQTDEENHAEIDFTYINDLIDAEKEAGNTPILIYCFSGQTLSLAVCIAYLMRAKKWSLEFSTAYMMKICPNFRIPSWLYTQLQRLDLKSSKKQGKTNTTNKTNLDNNI